MLKKINVLIFLFIISLILVSCKSSIETSKTLIDTENEINDELLSNEESAEELEKKLEERKNLEKDRKELLKEFYVPLPDINSNKEKITKEVRALYATGYTAGNKLNKESIELYASYIRAIEDKNTQKINELSSKIDNVNKFERIIGLIISTELNGVVINIKDDNGFITYNTDIEIVKKMNEETPIPIRDIKEMISILKEYDIYSIGRIVAFKDKNFAMLNPLHSIQLKGGGVWLDPNSGNIPWINPFDKYVWDYNICIAKEAALLGFDEIQFDYVRFPDGAKTYNLITEFPDRNERDKDEAIAQFLEYAKSELEEYSVNLSADVFGLITKNWDDYPEDIGQTWIMMGKYVDSLAPMVYPSHYSTGWYDLDNPNAHPYLVVKGAMEEAIEKNSSMENPPVIRPWLQDFDWAGIAYGEEKIREQIIAAKELDVKEYMMWNPSNIYNPYSYIQTEKEKNTTYPIDKGELDYREKSPADAAEKFLIGMSNARYSYMYLMTPVSERENDFDKFIEEQEKSNIDLVSYEIIKYTMDNYDSNLADVELNLKYKIIAGEKEEIIEKENILWKAVREKNIWKIKAEFEK